MTSDDLWWQARDLEPYQKRQATHLQTGSPAPNVGHEKSYINFGQQRLKLIFLQRQIQAQKFRAGFPKKLSWSETSKGGKNLTEIKEKDVSSCITACSSSRRPPNLPRIQSEVRKADCGRQPRRSTRGQQQRPREDHLSRIKAEEKVC